VCIHIEPYEGRDAATLKTNLQYILHNYGSHPAYYRRQHKNKLLPMFYIYDSYNLNHKEWARIFTPGGDLSVRNSDLDGIFIGLLVETKHRQDLVRGGFDGFYTYFASSGFSYGSNINNWKNLAREAAGKGLIFIPSVGPGYVDDRIRPWNMENTKVRNNGKYYENYFKTAVNVDPPIISITSFNEWHEGTQIEKAVSKQIKNYTYLDYSPNQPDYYLSLTRKWVLKFMKLKKEKHVT
jgi:glycoprotein endo-alpha-1,2-mannosidase